VALVEETVGVERAQGGDLECLGLKREIIWGGLLFIG
jgi:hypothetical protein